jgi:hypothetical protein
MNNEFPNANDEVKRLANEIEALREDIQGASRKLAQMERRLRAVFPNLPKKPKNVKAERRPTSRKSAEQLKEDFQMILRAVQRSGPQGFDSALAGMPQEDVIALAIELGVGQAKRTTLNKAIQGIRKRIQERIMLGHTRSGERDF